MVKTIVHDPLFLAQKSETATEADRQIMIDLMDTLRANLDRCVGMAANMRDPCQEARPAWVLLFCCFYLLHPVAVCQTSAKMTL